MAQLTVLLGALVNVDTVLARAAHDLQPHAGRSHVFHNEHPHEAGFDRQREMDNSQSRSAVGSQRELHRTTQRVGVVPEHVDHLIGVLDPNADRESLSSVLADDGLRSQASYDGRRCEVDLNEVLSRPGHRSAPAAFAVESEFLLRVTGLSA